MQNTSSIFTDKKVLYLYYVLALAAIFTYGYSLYAAVLGAYITRYFAKKEHNPLVRSHAQWIIRSFWYSILVFLVGLFILSVYGTFADNIFTQITPEIIKTLDFDELSVMGLIKYAYLGIGLVMISLIYCVTRYLGGLLSLTNNKVFYEMDKAS